MKILLIQEAGRHKSNAHFREALSYQRAFSKLGVESFVWGLNYDSFKIPFDEIQKYYDVLFLLENYDEIGWVPNLSAYKQLKINLAVDAHCNLQHLVSVCNKNSINIHFGATLNYLNHFKAPDRECHWLPNCFDDSLVYPMPEINKEHNIGFCGNVLNRKEWLDRLEKEFNLKKDIFVIGEDMVKAINSYKTAWNHSLSDDINYRVFETTGCNTLLFTNYVPTLELLFDTKYEVVTYDTFEDLKEKFQFFIENEPIRKKVAEKGYLRAKQDHTFVNRAQKIIEVVNKHG